jgi:hypothetical protein
VSGGDFLVPLQVGVFVCLLACSVEFGPRRILGVTESARWKYDSRTGKNYMARWVCAEEL